MEQKQYLIDEGLAQAIVSYLSTKPFNEVVHMINAMQQIPEIDNGGQLGDVPPGGDNGSGDDKGGKG